MELTQCPQCGVVAEVVDRDVWASTDGPVEHVHVRCVTGHRFVMPSASLVPDTADRAPSRSPGDLVPVLVRPRRHDPDR